MIVFENIKPGCRLRGLDPSGLAEVVQVAQFGADALNVVFRVDGRVDQRLVMRGEETGFEFVEAGRTYAFDADGSLLRLASEAYRIRLAYLFDPYIAVTASQIEALPHQITAVYGEMLPRQPLRFLLADDPGAGKTIMAGLLIKELLIRGDLERCLVVAPGALVEQWQDEMAERFGLAFDILSRDQIEASLSGNPFAERNRLIVRLDVAARSDELQAKIAASPEWDLVICDEAHRMSASYFSGEVKETRRYKLGKLLGARARHLLLMSATPHNGKEADFQLFMGLLDADRFEGRFREGVHKADVSDMMRRLTKEELYRFDGTPLFPERKAYTANYSLSPDEAALYAAVTTYVREEMNRAELGQDGKRRSNVGFALQILQRRLASSPAAIYKSLERRRKRLEERLREEEALRPFGKAPLQGRDLPTYDPDEIDEATGEEVEAAENEILDQATAALNLDELRAEIDHLTVLEDQALRLKQSLLAELKCVKSDRFTSKRLRSASAHVVAGRKHTAKSRCVSAKRGIDSGKQIRCDGCFGDKSVGSCLNRRQLHTLFSVDAKSDQLQLRELAPDTADQPESASARQGEIDYGQSDVEMTRGLE